MPLTVRLDPKTERALSALAKRYRLSRSQIVREALVRFEAGERSRDTRTGPYAAWLDVIGTITLGVRDHGRTTGEQFAALVRERRRGRRAN